MHPTYTSKFPELGFYGLPGHSRTPRDILKQAQDAEALGIGNIMISERADYKEISGLMRCRSRGYRQPLHRHVRHQPQHPSSGNYRLHGIHFKQPL